MRIKMLSRVHTIAIVAVTMLMVGNSVGQEHKIIQKKSDSDSPNIVVWQSDDGEKIELDVEALKSDGGVFVFEKKDDKKAPKKKPQAFKWNFKSADSKDKKNNEMRFHSVDSKEGNVIVVVNEDGKKITKKFQVHGADGKENVWIEKDDDGKSGPHVIVLGDDQGKSGNKKIQIIGKDGAKGHWSEKGPAGKHVIILGDDHGEKKIQIHGPDGVKGHWVEGGDHQLIIVDEKGNIKKLGKGDGEIHILKAHGKAHSHDDHGHGKSHDHGDHRKIELKFGDSEGVHGMIEGLLKKHDLSMDDENIDVQVTKNNNGELEVRVTAGDDGKGKKSKIKKRIEMKVDGDIETELHELHNKVIRKLELKGHDHGKSDRVERRVIRVRPEGSDEEMEVEVEVLVDDEAKSDSAKKHRVIQKKAKSAATKAKAKAKAKPQRRDSDDRLEQLEKRLESLERKIEKAIKSLDRSSGR